MNTGSPLKPKAEPKPIVVKKTTYSGGTAKKILKDSGAVIGVSEVAWLNRYMANKVAGECLPKSFLSNDLYAEICRTYGKGSAQFIDQIVQDFKRENGLFDTIEEEVTVPNVSSDVHGATIP
nr:MAG: hypothetical protein [Lake Baikal virophage 11]